MGRGPSPRQASRPGSFDALLPGPSAIDELLELFRHEPSAVRLVRGKDKKGSDNYRLVDGSLDLVAIRNDFADGYTIVFDGVEQYVRAVGTLARSIEVELNFPIQVNSLYHSARADQGWLPHYDDHDVLILQIQGSKIWHLYVGADLPPREIQRDNEKAVAVEGLPMPTDIRPGSRRRAVRAARPRSRCRDSSRAIRPSDRRNSRTDRADACHRCAVLAELSR